MDYCDGGNTTMLIFLAPVYLRMSDRAGESSDDCISEIRFTVERRKAEAA